VEYQDTKILDWYVYNAIFDALAAAPGTLTRTINIETDANFILFKLTGFADIALANQTYNTRVVPLVNLQITDTGSGRQLLNGDTAWSNIVGWGEIPYILPIRRKFKAGTTIRIQATNRSATVYNLALSLSGIKDFGNVEAG